MKDKRRNEMTTHIVCHEYQHQEEGKKDCGSIEGRSQCPSERRHWGSGREDDDVSKLTCQHIDGLN